MRFARNLVRRHLDRNPAQVAFSGHVDGVFDGVIMGWVRRDDSDEPVTVDVLADGAVLAQGLPADRPRPDVAAAGFGAGACGFACPLPPAAWRTDADVALAIRLAGTDRTLLERAVTLPPLPEAPAATAEPAPEPTPEPEPEPAAPPADLPCFDARIEVASATELRGWAVDRADPGRVVTVDVLIDGLLFRTIRADLSRGDLERNGLSRGLGGLRLALPLRLLGGGVHRVSLRLPDGQRVDTEIRAAAAEPRRHTTTAPIPPEDVAIIVPVHNAAEDVATCIDRLAAHTPEGVEILFIDDASPDPAISGLMARAAALPGMRVLHNRANLGFTGTVNRGLEAVGRKHAILLNSDARVTPGWVEGLLAAAVSRPRVATVTAMSDRAGAFSAPDPGNENPLPPGVDEITYARAFRRRGLGLYPQVPTGNGFCMFVNRACLDAVGLLDAAAFPRGYGEENDFCMRAGRAGWVHLVDDRTYVFHDRSKSFGEEKTALIGAGRAVIDARYPEYRQAIQVFTQGTPLAVARLRARQAQADCADRRAALPRVLFVVATENGGTPQTNMDLMAAISPDCDPWLMRCDSRRMVLMHWRDGALHEVAEHVLDEELEPIRHQSDDYDRTLADWLARHDFATVHIRHIAWHSINLPAIAKAQGCTVVFSFHDFYTLCPSVKLLTAEGDWYGGDLTRLHGAAAVELWPVDSMPFAGAAWVGYWRQRFGAALAVCDAFATTSDSTRDMILRHLPGIDAAKFHVVPHGRDFPQLVTLRQQPRHGQPLRILVPGNISRAKGLAIIRDLLAIDHAGLLEFHVLGKMERGVPIDSPRLIEHGTYRREQFAERVRALDIHLGAVFSIWDETWCHTLTELWSVGVPAMVFDFPTVAGRVRESGAGWVLPHGDVAALYRAILDLAFDAGAQSRADAALAAWQAGPALAGSTQLMAARYLEVYRIASGNGGPRPLVAVVAPASPDLSRANASTEIRLWARTRNSDDRPLSYVRMTPAGLLANLRAGALDGALIQRNVIPPTMIAPLLAALAEAGTDYAVELDDDLLDVPEDKDPTGGYRAYGPLLRDLIAGARLVTASTPPLAERLRALNPRTRLLPNLLDEALWRGPMPEASPGAGITALYMDDTTHGADFDMIAPALARVAADHPGFRLAVIGVHDGTLPDWAERITVPDAAKTYNRFVPWLKSIASGFDFGLAPLQDTPFNRHKSALKLLDNLALGLPVLASDVLPYRAMAGGRDGVTLVRNDPEAWKGALAARIGAGRTGMAERDRLRRMVLRGFGLTASLPDFDAMLVETLAGALACRDAPRDRLRHPADRPAERVA